MAGGRAGGAGNGLCETPGPGSLYVPPNRPRAPLAQAVHWHVAQWPGAKTMPLTLGGHLRGRCHLKSPGSTNLGSLVSAP